MSALVLNLTTMCNAKCAFCIVFDSLNRPDLTMSRAEVYETLEKARREGAREVNYSGGEPTIYKGFTDVVRYARDLGYDHQSINTNGIRLKDPAYCEELLEAGMSSIDFSIHGHTEELHDREVARKGAFRAIVRACGNLNELKERFRFNMSATTVMTRHNHHHLLDIVKMLEELGFDNKRLKYAYEGNLTTEQIINEVAPYEEVVPSLVEALEYLAVRPFGFHFTHVPICLMGDTGAFSHDFHRRPAIMAFRESAYEGEAAHFFREDGNECERCAIANLCTRLDGGYQTFHGRPNLEPFADHEAVEAMFDRAIAKYPMTESIIGWTRGEYRRHRDSGPLETRERERLASQHGERKSG